MTTTRQDEQPSIETAEEQPTTRSTRLLTLLGAVVGATAYLAGYWAVRFLKEAEIVYWKTTGSQFGEEPLSLFRSAEGATPGVSEMAGWLFYAAHNIGVELVVEYRGPFSTESALLSLQGTFLWDTYLLLIPVGLLFTAGMLLGWFWAGNSKMANAKAGVRVAAGYLPLVVVGALIMTWSYSPGGQAGTTDTTVQTVTFHTPVLLSAIVGGVGYPLIWGGAGGIVGGFLRKKLQGVARSPN